jgi:phage protein D
VTDANKVMQVETWAPYLSVILGGDKELAVSGIGYGEVIDVTVQQSVSDIDSFTVTLINWDDNQRKRKYIATKPAQIVGLQPTPQFPFGLGQPLEITMGYPSWKRKLIMAEITKLMPVFPSGGPATITIDGSDGLHRLKGNTRNKSYAGKPISRIVKDVVDLANTDTKKSPLKTEITPPNIDPPLEYIYQFNQSDAAFLKECAGRVGHEVFVRGDTLYFRPPPDGAPQKLVLEYGHTLESLTLSLNIGNQPSAVEVRSWNGKEGKTIKYKTTDLDLAMVAGSGFTGPKARAQVFGAQPVVITDVPVRSEQEAKALAVARLQRLMQDFVTVRGATVGMPDLKPGGEVTIKGIDPVLEGDYYLTACTHKFGAQGYRTEFQARRTSL